ncbi:Arylsulfatase [Rubripirellula lacrimiformis]|uniref:Arylsulfatase n=1 Tax=Rubripirellula lacrimiformis TaxID=1930273 RepID=A0A517NE16_9BACT|nr:sulfatase-like hydrolase/transferase [Rubripirellula lacrimiformis]QDT05371.1 Arylsulfatase [Rubripirellula lacrimiformis]
MTSFMAKSAYSQPCLRSKDGLRRVAQLRMGPMALAFCAVWLGPLCGGAVQAQSNQRPHVVLILADDLGYGDVQPLNPDSTIQTPAFNRLAAEGITFTDAHTPSAVCTPTRYGLVTGQYCWRTRLKRGVLDGYGSPLIDADRATLGSVFSDNGYRTAIVGKWHLGLGLVGGKANLDLAKPLTEFPGMNGFESSFVIPASLDFPPYAYFRDGKATTSETVDQSAVGFPAYTRQGPRAVDFELRGCLDRLTDEAVTVISGMKESDRPTMLYFPLTAPHKPVLPAKRFVGTSNRGDYGDFVRQVDATIGRVVDALESEGVLDQTIVIVTSDNGSFMYRIDEGQPDHLDDESVQGFHAASHRSNANWRGTKADVWEGGHRVPFFVRMPEKMNAGQKVNQVVGLVDVMATLADHLNLSTTDDAGPDSVSFAKLLADPNADYRRSPLVCHSVAGMFALRAGKWKMVAGNGSGGREKPKGKPFETPYMLFDLEADPGETNNIADAHPQIVQRMTLALEKIRNQN